MIVWLHVFFRGCLIGRDLDGGAHATFPIFGFIQIRPSRPPPAARVPSAGQTVYFGDCEHANGRGEGRRKHNLSLRELFHDPNCPATPVVVTADCGVFSDVPLSASRKWIARKAYGAKLVAGAVRLLDVQAPRHPSVGRVLRCRLRCLVVKAAQVWLCTAASTLFGFQAPKNIPNWQNCESRGISTFLPTSPLTYHSTILGITRPARWLPN